MTSPDFIPVNRHLRVSVARQQQKTPSGVLLPEDFSESKDKYQRVEVLAAAADCKEVFRTSVGKEIFVEKSMVEEILVMGTTASLVLENYVIGVLP